MKKLVAYMTAAYPSVEFSIDLALGLKENGVDSLELGVPFSDPVADGPIIEKANRLALERGFRFSHLCEISREITPSIDTLWMGYVNPFYQIGFHKICKEAQSLGVCGLIIPDLPFEESVAYAEEASAHGLALIRFIAPTTPRERIATLANGAQKFIYLVAYAGITGAGKEEALAPVIESIRAVSETPIFLGFGVNEKNAKEKAKGVDGVIVGSAFVKILLEKDLSDSQKLTQICTLAKRIKEAINS